VTDAPRTGRMPACAHAATNRAAPYSPSRSVSATAGMPSAAARATSCSGVNAPSFNEKHERTSRWTKGSIAHSPETFAVQSGAVGTGSDMDAAIVITIAAGTKNIPTVNIATTHPIQSSTVHTMRTMRSPRSNGTRVRTIGTETTTKTHDPFSSYVDAPLEY